MSEVSKARPAGSPPLAERPWFLPAVLVITLLFWGSAFVAIPIALRTVEAQAVIAGRLLLSTLVFLPFIARDWRKTIRPGLKKDGKLFLAMAFLGVTLYLLALTYGQRTVGAGQTSLIVNLTPLMTGAFATIFLKETFHPRLIVGGLVALGGVGLLITSRGGSFSLDPNSLLILGATVSASLFYIIQRSLSARYSALTLSALSVVAGTFLYLPFSAGAWEGFGQASLPSLVAIAYLGLGCGVVPYVGWVYILSRMPAAKATLFLYFVPVISTTLGWLILGEQVTVIFLASGAIIILGVIIGNGVIKRERLSRKKLPPLPARKDCLDPR